MMKRRNMLLLGLAAGTTATGVYFYNGERPAPPVPESRSDQLVIETGFGKPVDNLLKSLAGSIGIGQAWLDSLDSPPGMGELAAEIGRRLDVTAPDLEAEAAALVNADFAANRVCIVDGWELSLAECQLAALRYLAISERPENESILAEGEQLPLLDTLTIGRIAPLENWGPRGTTQGVNVNEQPDGHTGLWFQIAGAPVYARIMVDGQLMNTRVRETAVTSGIYGRLQERVLSTPGRYEIALVDPLNRIKQPIGEFEVIPDPTLSAVDAVPEGDSVFCAVDQWGPRSTAVGVAANEQPDGSMGIWVHLDCLPDDTRLMFVDDLLSTTRRPFGLTARIPLPLLESAGDKPLYLFDPATGERRLIGSIRVN